MITQTYQGKQEVEYSIVNLGELEGALRIDAEYYDPVYLRNEESIKNKTWDYLGNYLVICQYGISIAMNEVGDGYKMLKMDDIIGILADDANAKYAPISEDLFKKYKLNKKDVLFNRVNSEEFVGRTGIYLLDGDHTFASYLIRIRAKQDYANSYITIFLKTKYGQKTLRRVSRRAVNQANINAEELKQLKIPTPTDTFQKEIENLVLESQQERENAEYLYKEAEDILLEELKLKEWKPKAKKKNIDGVEFEEEKNISIKKLSEALEVNRLDAEYWDPKYDELEDLIKDYEMGWDYLANLIYISKEKIKQENEEIYNYIELADINSNLGSVNQTQEIKGSDLPSRARMDIREGDILMSSVEGSIDKIALIDFEKNNLVASTGFFVFREDKLNKETILVLLNIFSERYIKRQAQGTILTAIPYDSLNRVILPIVNPKIQSIIAQRIQQSFESRRKSKELLEIAKKSVEVYIEKDEEEGSRYINEELQKMETN